MLSFILERSDDTLEGEVVASADTAAACAPRYKSTPEAELLLYVIHGTLHIVGYDDTTPRQRAVMRRKEKEYLVKTQLMNPSGRRVHAARRADSHPCRGRGG